MSHRPLPTPPLTCPPQFGLTILTPVTPPATGTFINRAKLPCNCPFSYNVCPPKLNLVIAGISPNSGTSRCLASPANPRPRTRLFPISHFPIPPYTPVSPPPQHPSNTPQIVPPDPLFSPPQTIENQKSPLSRPQNPSLSHRQTNP